MCVQVTFESGAGDDARDLRSWLSGETEFRGRVRLRERPPEQGSLGALTEAVEVALGPGGAITALATSVVVWLRSRRGSVTIKLTRDNDTVELSTRGVRDLDAAEIRSLVTSVAETLETNHRETDGSREDVVTDVDR